MIPLAMIFFAVLDLALSGVRATMGRDGRIAKRDLHLRGLWRGLSVGVSAVAGLGVATGITLWLSSNGALVYDDMLAIARRMLLVFSVFTVLVVGALAVYGASRHEVRTLATVAILGPFTLVRPWVVAGATIFGLVGARTMAASALTILSGAAVIGLDRYLEWSFDAEMRWTRLRGPKSLDAPPSSRAGP